MKSFFCTLKTFCIMDACFLRSQSISAFNPGRNHERDSLVYKWA